MCARAVSLSLSFSSISLSLQGATTATARSHYSVSGEKTEVSRVRGLQWFYWKYILVVSTTVHHKDDPVYLIAFLQSAVKHRTPDDI